MERYCAKENSIGKKALESNKIEEKEKKKVTLNKRSASKHCTFSKYNGEKRCVFQLFFVTYGSTNLTRFLKKGISLFCIYMLEKSSPDFSNFVWKKQRFENENRRNSIR